MARIDEPSTEILPARHDRSAPTLFPRVELAPLELVGRSFGKFTILELLGRGGSGEVYRAEQAPLGRSAVVKVLRREVSAAPNRVERFLREARLASRLDHPYAAHVYAFGAEPDGVLWIAMEYVRGSTLDQLISERGPMPPHVFVPLFGRLCEVVHSAHELGIVHRDIKGGNVMVIERAGELLPKLLDFGIAKGDGQQPSPGVAVDDDALTGHGSTLGSPQYMSPEQWESPSDVDARADVYGLGVLAYRCVSGSLPFRTTDRIALGDAHLHITPPPMLEAPAAIGQVVLRALMKRPEDRWQTALQFAQAMRRAVGGTAPEVVPILDPATRDVWIERGPQPIADAIAHLAAATTTIDADAALREVVAITCRWLAVLSLANLPSPWPANPTVRESARAVVGREDGSPWLHLAQAAIHAAPALDGIARAIGASDALAQLADRLDDRDRQNARGTGSEPPVAGLERTQFPASAGANLAAEVAALAEALRPLEPMLAYKLVVGRVSHAESWQGTRRRDRDRVIVWGEPLADGEVALLDPTGRAVAWLSPFVQIVSPLPSAEPELFVLWRSGRGSARLVAAPWGFERDDDAAGQRLAALSTEELETGHDVGAVSPYPGLLPYSVDDAEVFVGREREIESLANRLVRAPMIAVLGPSGVGKSSFIHAGVLPRLREHYQILTMRPGRHPLHALASLSSVSGHADDPDGLVDRLRELGDSAARGVVVIIDQFEELATLCADADERRVFADVLARAADGAASPVRVVVTLRDDFATVLESEAPLRGKFDVFVLATPTPEALRRIVIEPAKRAGVTVDPRVVDDMVAEVAGRPASLPLLSFTASQLWATRDRQDRRITHDAYLQLGGVAGALSAYADHVYGSLARRDQEVVRDVFARLVANDGTRIPMPRRELEELPGATPDAGGDRGLPKARGVLAHLIDARLLVVREDDHHDIVEIVHECLAERWPRLARWRSEDAVDRDLLTDVRAGARRWHESGRRPDLLWRGEALAELRRLAARTTAFTDVERAFAEAADRAEQKARSLRRRLVMLAMTALVGGAGVMAYLSVDANTSRAAAERAAVEAHTAAQLAEDRLTAGLVSQGKQELNDGHAQRALAYFGEAMRRHADTQGLRQMVSIASRAWKDEVLVQRNARIISVMPLSAGGFVAGDQSGHIHYYTKAGAPDGDVATELSMLPELRPTPSGGVIAVGREGIVIVDSQRKHVAHIKPKENPMTAAYGPGTDEVISVERDALNIYGLDGTLRRSMPIALDQAESEPAYDKGARHVFLATAGAITMLDTVAMTTKVIAKDVFAGVVTSEDASALAYLDKEHVVHLITSDGSPIRTLRAASPVSHLAFSASGDRLAAISEHDATIFDTSANSTGATLATFAIESSPVDAEVRGDDLWTASNDGVVRHYHDGALVASLPSQLTEIDSLALSGDLLATIGSDTTFALLRADATQLQLAERPCPHPQFAPEDIAISYLCGDRQAIYVGRHHVGDIKDASLGFVAVEPSTGRGAYGSRTVTVFDANATPIATASETTGHTGAIAFEDRDHLLVAELDKSGKGLWRWDFLRDRWEHVVDLREPGAIAMTAGGIMVGFVDGHVEFFTGAARTSSTHRLDLHDRVEFITTTRDRRIAAVQLGSGGTVIVDTEAGTVLRQLVPSDAIGSAPTFDSSGELLLRASRGTTTIWDRTTGDYLVFDFDLMRHTENAVFGPDDTIEIGGRQSGVITIRRDARPATEIVREIDCKVPLRVANGRLEPSPVDCGR